MFIVRCVFWLAVVVMLLPPSSDGEAPAPRMDMFRAALSLRVLIQDMTGVCARHPEACAQSREALALFARKLETGAGIVSAGISAGRGYGELNADHGTLTAADFEPEWSFPKE
jgi:hypothetical protein